MIVNSRDGPLVLGLVSLLLSITTSTTIAGADDPKPEDYEPQFPYLFDPTSNSQMQVKIVSESMEDKAGYKLQEEYLDLAAGRNALVAANKKGNQVIFLNAMTGRSYSYKPYSCEVKHIDDMPQVFSEALGNIHEWNYRKTLSPPKSAGEPLVPIEGDEDASSEKNGQKSIYANSRLEFRVFGVAGLWLFAEHRPKSFSREKKLVYSVSKDLYQESLVWTVIDSKNDLLIKFHFIEGPATQYRARTLSLQMIQVVSNAKESQNKVLRTINVLSVDYRIDADTYDDYLDIPIGYGCFERQVQPIGSGDGPLEMIGGVNTYWNQVFTSSKTGVIDLEVTATKFNSDTDAKSATTSTRTSDTMSIQIAHSLLGAFKALDMVRIRNTEQDVKFVSNYKYKVKYMMDLRRGTCELSHVRFAPTKETWHDEVLRFNNGLQLDVVRNHFDLFDYSTNPFHFIKETRASVGRLEQHFYENTVDMDAFRELNLLGPKSNKKARVIRSYTREEPNTGGLTLSSVSIWVLNEAEDKLEETYQINVIESKFVTGWPDEPKVFDVSEECYLNNNDLMKSGRDFAWIELTYPASPRILNLLAANEMEMKRQFYENYVKKDKLDFTRVPQVELLFDNEDSFVIRMLLLNTPPLQFVYDKHPGRVIRSSLAGDSNHLAPDLEHCADLCRMSYCTIMSYCRGAMTCLLSSRSFGHEIDQAEAEGNKAGTTNNSILTENESCDSYTLPFIGSSVDQFDLEYFHSASLPGILAQLQHQDYGITNLPQVPDEVALPRSETLLSNQEYTKAMSDYLGSVFEHLNKESTRLPELTISANLEDHFFVLLPNKFELENDPLKDFDLLDDDSMDSSMGDLIGDGDSGRAPAFHQGLPMFRYKVTVVEHLVDISKMDGLTYDQCALACLDGKCGSFSYCKNRQECVMTNVNTTGRAQALGLVERDPECFIAQRDFLTNFVKFSNAYRPQLYESVADSVDVSDCALQCVSHTDFRCLAFDFCLQPPLEGQRPTGFGRCYYHKNRAMGYQNIQPTYKPPKAVGGANNTATEGQTQTGCDHYARSYLADYNRLEYRSLDKDRLMQMKTNQIEGQTVFRCAEMCSNELIDCTAFQFCFHPDNPGAKQKCTMIESKPPGDDKKTDKDEDFNAIIDENEGGRLVRAGKYLEHSAGCHLFTMRRDSSEAHLRDLAFGGTMTVAEQQADEARQRAASGSFWGHLFWMYIMVSLLSVAVGLTVSFARENRDAISDRFRHTSSHLRVRLGI